MSIKRELEQEIELAKMMVADLDKIFKKYAKAAMAASEARAEKIRFEKYKDCINAQELQELYGWGEISEDEYQAGLDFFYTQESRKSQLSLVEQHRKNVKELRDRWKGTAKELQQELDEVNGVVKDNRTFIEKLEHEERAARYTAKY